MKKVGGRQFELHGQHVSGESRKNSVFPTSSVIISHILVHRTPMNEEPYTFLIHFLIFTTHFVPMGTTPRK